MKKSMGIPFGWYGGKASLTPVLLELIPKHDTYVEAFGGSGALLFAKEPVDLEIYNDVDHGLVHFFRVLRDEKKFEQLVRKAQAMPYSREEFYRCKETWFQDVTIDDVEKAFRWWVLASWSFSGVITHGGWRHSRQGKSPAIGWMSRIKKLPMFHQRLKHVCIEQDNALVVVARYDSNETFHYLDPPYVLDTRTKEAYQHEMSAKEHNALIDVLLKLNGYVLLSGYRNEYYERLERKGWIRHDHDVFAAGARRTKTNKRRPEKMRRIESLWLNPKLSKEVDIEKATKKEATTKRTVKKRPR